MSRRRQPYELIQAYLWWTADTDEPTLLGRGIANYEFRQWSDGHRLESELCLVVRLNVKDSLVEQMCDVTCNSGRVHRIVLSLPITDDEPRREFTHLRLREVPVLEQREELDGKRTRFLSCRFAVGVP